MSAILDALKRVEEQLRKGQGGQPGEIVPIEIPVEASSEGAASEADEVTRVYLSIINEIAKMRGKMLSSIEECRSELRASALEENKKHSSLHNEISNLSEALRKEIEERRNVSDTASTSQKSLVESLEQVHKSITQSFSGITKEIADLKSESLKKQQHLIQQKEQQDVGRNALSKLASEFDSLKKETTNQRNAFVEFQKKLDFIQSDTIKMIDSVKSNDAATKSAFAGRSEIEPLIKGLTEIRSSVLELMNTLNALRADFSRQQELTTKERERRDGERLELIDAISAIKNETLRLFNVSSESQDTISELSKAVESLQKDACGLKERVRKENNQRDLERDAVNDLFQSTRTEVETIAKACESLQNSVGDLTGKLQEAQNEATALRNASQQDRETLASMRNGFHQVVEELRREFAGFKDDQPILHAAMKEDTQDVAALREDVSCRDLDPILRDQSDIRKSLDELQGQMAPLKNGQSILQDAMEMLTRDITQLRGDATKKEREESVRDQSEFRKSIGELRESFALLSNEQSTLHDLMETISRDMVTLRGDTARFYDSLEHERGRLHARMDGNAEAAQGAWENVLSRMDAFRVQIEKRDLEIDELQEKIKTIERELKRVGGNGKETKIKNDEREESQSEIDRFGAQRLHAAAGEAYAKGDHEEALRLLDIIDTAFPNNKSILYNRVECLIHLGKNKEAREMCDYLINILGHEPAEALIEKIPR